MRTSGRGGRSTAHLHLPGWCPAPWGWRWIPESDLAARGAGVQVRHVDSPMHKSRRRCHLSTWEGIATGTDRYSSPYHIVRIALLCTYIPTRLVSILFITFHNVLCARVRVANSQGGNLTVLDRRTSLRDKKYRDGESRAPVKGRRRRGGERAHEKGEGKVTKVIFASRAPLYHSPLPPSSILEPGHGSRLGIIQTCVQRVSNVAPACLPANESPLSSHCRLHRCI